MRRAYIVEREEEWEANIDIKEEDNVDIKEKSSSDSLHILPSSSSQTNAQSGGV